jgi:tetratricopeptide (TPR) repeat protein
MKLKSIPATIPISLLALFFAITWTAPAAAQYTNIKLKTSKMMAATDTDNPRIKPGEIDLNTAKTPAAKTAAVVENKTTSPQDADYWFDKGALCATYGNDRAAIRYFQKAISLNPNLSGAYFEQGISYGQLGDFDKALTLVDKALEMEPQNGLYLYGRGRVYLLAGKQDQAMEDFKNAAALDDEDAQNYLKHVAQF